MHINYRTDEKYNNRGVLISIAIHAALLLAFFFIIVMKNPPDVPLEEDGSGVPVNFGYDDFGMGDNNEQPSVSEAVPVKTEPLEEVKPADADEAEVVTTAEESPYKIEEKKEKEKKKVEPKKITEPVKETKETKTATTTEPKTAVNKNLDKRNSMGNGDKNVAGDQGKENGTLDSKNYYGNAGSGGPGPGGSGGGGLSMSGWRPTSDPIVVDKSSESGKIVFKITVDEDGTILSAIPVENQLSPAVTKYYKDAVMKVTLEKTSTGKAAEASVGYWTFIIRTK